MTIVTHVPPIVVLPIMDVVILRFTVHLPLVRSVRVMSRPVVNILLLFVMIMTLVLLTPVLLTKGVIIVPFYVMMVTNVQLTIVWKDFVIMIKSHVMIKTLVLLILAVKKPENANLFQRIVMIIICVHPIPVTGESVQTKLLAVPIKMHVR